MTVNRDHSCVEVMIDFVFVSSNSICFLVVFCDIMFYFSLYLLKYMEVEYLFMGAQILQQAQEVKLIYMFNVISFCLRRKSIKSIYFFLQ